MEKYYKLSDKSIPDISAVGGKARSLMQLISGGFNVPGGSVLSVAFFDDWIETLTQMDEFRVWASDPARFSELASVLKGKAIHLNFNDDQIRIVDEIMAGYPDDKTFAVRSSSPEEDLAGASFAGGYETILGTVKDMMFESIKKAFMSCLDERVFFYKYQNGFDTRTIRIAVIIQEQLNSSSSGVGFSLNPVNNYYDEAIINSNVGLGESVVSGMVTPDEFIVDKVSMTMVKRNLGSKDQAIILNEGGGTISVNGIGDKPSITDAQIKELTELIVNVERHFNFPVDIEWAYQDGLLYLLQSRPITAYIPLPDSIKTSPGEQKLLFIDGSTVKQGITTPISFMGCDCILETQKVMFTDMMGKDVASDFKGGLAATTGGRMYVNLSTSLKLQSQKRMAAMWRTVDMATADLIMNMDISEYTLSTAPDTIKGVKWGTVKSNVGTVKMVLRAMKYPREYKEEYLPVEEAFDDYLAEVLSQNIPLADVPVLIFEEYIKVLHKSIPMTYAAETARLKIKKMLKETQDLEMKMAYLERSLPGNVTIDMGLRMYDLSQYDEIKNNSYEAFKTLLKTNQVSDDFRSKWDAYMNTHGFRCVKELDIASVRPYEDYKELFRQIKGMANVSDENNPYIIYEDSKRLREETYEEIKGLLDSPASLKKFEKYYNTLVELGGYREALKYWFIKSIDIARRTVMKKADELVADGKLNDRMDIFGLTLKQADASSQMDLEMIYDLILQNTAFYEKLKHVKDFPKVIDSRGKIIRPVRREAGEGELVGDPVSPGKTIGRVKVLHAPDEKPLLPGEVMVAKATDPGWTPLFINASAILLEVGGILQHGSLVAREYGKPCIAGMEGVVDRLKDGQLVEVDAINGIVKILED